VGRLRLRERGTAIGIWAGVSALGLAIGPLVGGLLTEHVGWSAIFYNNVPIGLAAIAASFLLIDESKDMTHRQRADLRGQLACGVGLFTLTYGLIEANAYGWARHASWGRSRSGSPRSRPSCS
jgi:MFS family permease